MRVLVLDANQRSALAVTRSLGLSPHTIITADETSSALAGASKYSDHYLQYPSPSQEPKAFCEWLLATTHTEQIDWVFPVTEISSQLILLHPQTLGTARIPFAQLDQVMNLADKWQLVQLADRIGVKFPRSVHAESASTLNAAIMAGLEYPVVLKPTQSRRWLGDRWLTTAVHIARSATELTALLNEKSYLRNYPFMLQEFIPGHGAGVFALYDRGNAITFFSHQRLREKPPRGGVSVLSQSAPLDKRLLDAAKALLDSAKWHGVAMVEFRVAADGTPYLMEVNTRFWGSLQLAIDSGVDFPALLLKTSLGEAADKITQYRIGQKLRWLLGDFDSLYLVLRDSSFSTREKIKRLVDFFTPDFGKTRHEVNRWNDLGPAWFELKSYIKSLTH